MKNNLLCPVCNSKYDAEDEFCSTCSWELIHIPERANNALLEYYNDRLNRHKESYTSLIETTASLKKTNTELLENVNALEEKKKEVESSKKEISKQKAKIDELTELKVKLEEYENRFGDSLTSVNSNGSKEIVEILWRIESNQLQLECNKSNLKYLPSKIAVLFSKKPSLFIGKCDFILLCEIKQNKDSVFVEIKSQHISKGEYFVKLASLDNSNAIIKFSNEAMRATSNNFDKTKTKLNII